MLDVNSLRLLAECVQALADGFSRLPPYRTDTEDDALRKVLLETARRLHDNDPYFHPLYAAHMHKPPHTVARLAYALALYINPNNHSLEGGRASTAMEQEAVQQLAGLCGWDHYLGHLTGGGTMANLEALWIAGCLRPDATVLASSQAHYTHERLCTVLRLPFAAVAVDHQARMCMEALQCHLDQGTIGTVVATLGTTAAGAVDALHRLVELRKDYGFRLHVDAAYGGYFSLIDTLAPQTLQAMQALGQADSVVIDPHKHGLQPYGCGCVLFKDPAVGRFYQHGSPYTYFSSDALQLGKISLECSRAGAAAVALWATQRLLPPIRGGAFAADLVRCRQAALALYDYLLHSPTWLTLMRPELDIVNWAPHGASATQISQRSRRIYEVAAAGDLYLALADYPAELLRAHWPEVEFDSATVTCLRSCLLKPEHLDWQGELCARLETAARAATHCD